VDKSHIDGFKRHLYYMEHAGDCVICAVHIRARLQSLDKVR